ncbi:hypothetical protein JCM3770_005224 [Rhodotorula araucariae]
MLNRFHEVLPHFTELPVMRQHDIICCGHDMVYKACKHHAKAWENFTEKHQSGCLLPDAQELTGGFIFALFGHTVEGLFTYPDVPGQLQFHSHTPGLFTYPDVPGQLQFHSHTPGLFTYPDVPGQLQFHSHTPGLFTYPDVPGQLQFHSHTPGPFTYLHQQVQPMQQGYLPVSCLHDLSEPQQQDFPLVRP